MLPLCHTVVRARKSPPPGGAFSDRRYGWSCGRITECRIQKKHTAVEVLPVGDLFSPICYPYSCGDVDIFSVGKSYAFRSL